MFLVKIMMLEKNGRFGRLTSVIEKNEVKEPDAIADVGILYAIYISVNLLSGC